MSKWAKRCNEPINYTITSTIIMKSIKLEKCRVCVVTTAAATDAAVIVVGSVFCLEISQESNEYVRTIRFGRHFNKLLESLE